MSTKCEKPYITHSTLFSLSHLEAVLLHVGNTLHKEANSPEDHARDVASGSEIWLWEFGHVWTVQNRDRQGDGPNPEHLEDPETKERKELVAFIIEAVVFARLQDAEKEEAGKSGGPDHDE